MMSSTARWLVLAGLVMAGCPVEYTVPLENEGGTSDDGDSDDDPDDDPDQDDSDEGSGDSEADCDEPFIVCDESCVDPQTDPLHCGECEDDCGPGGSCVQGECIDACDNTCDEIAEVCVSGTCECRPGFNRCDGTCVDLDIDPLNCGECGELCIEDEGGGKFDLYLCEVGECIDMENGCGEGLSECGQSCVDRQTHPLHCGVCNRACDGDEVCIDGECLDT